MTDYERDLDQARGAFNDAIAEALANAVQEGLTKEELQADFDAVLSLQEFGPSEEVRELLEGEQKPGAVRHPEVSVQLIQLTGAVGDEFGVIKQVSNALRRAGVRDGEIGEFLAEVTSGDSYDVLATCMRWAHVSY